MTSNQITKKLEKAGINLEGLTVSRDEVEIYCTTKGEFSRNKTEKKMKEISKALGFGGFKCAHGGWVLQNNYQSLGDYNDKSSQWHY